MPSSGVEAKSATNGKMMTMTSGPTQSTETGFNAVTDCVHMTSGDVEAEA